MSPTTTTATCPLGKTHTESTTISGGKHVNIVADDAGVVCLAGGGAGYALSFNGAGSSSVAGFQTIRCSTGSAIRVEDTSLTLLGTSATLGVSCPVGTAITVRDGSDLAGSMVSFEESIVGVDLDAPFVSPAHVQLASSNIEGNNTGMLFDGHTSSGFTRVAIRDNQVMGYIQGDHSGNWSHSGYTGNTALGCGSGLVATEGGLNVFGNADLYLHNGLWKDNCTDPPYAEHPLVDVYENATVFLQSHTFDANETSFLARVQHTADLTVQDSLLTDHAGVMAAGDGGIRCILSIGATSTIDEVDFWGLDATLEMVGCTSGTTYAWNPLFVTVGGLTHLLDGAAGSNAIDRSVRTAASVYGGGTTMYGAEDDGSGGFALDVDEVDLGWHWRSADWP